MPEWFEEWFGEEYLHLYPHRDEVDAERLVALLVRHLPWRRGWRVLDVACGAGRHLSALERAGALVFGFDLSRTLLHHARTRSTRPLARADMRAIPFRPRSMDLTVNLFTSFGYFARDEEHHDALGQMLATVRPGGWFVMDFLNPDQVRATLVAAEVATVGLQTVAIGRSVSPDGRFVHKTMTLPDGRRFAERVRLLEPAQLEAMMARHGASVRLRFGDYAGGPLGGGPRTLLLAEVPG